ncbi:MAG TPA: ABC-2 transporter permease [bacterium]
MWKLIKSDLDYQKNSILLFLGIIFFVFIYNASISPGNAEFMIFLMTFMMINAYVTIRVREKRNRLHFRLPLSARELGGSRILIVYVLSVLAIGVLFISHQLFQRHASFPYQRITIMIALSIFLFSLYFIFSDLFTSLFKKYGRFFVMLGVLILALFMVLGIVVMKQTNATGSPPGLLISIIDFVKNNNPFAGGSGWIQILVLN